MPKRQARVCIPKKTGIPTFISDIYTPIYYVYLRVYMLVRYDKTKAVGLYVLESDV